MPSPSRWFRQPALLLELFVVANVGFLAFDIYLAHSINQFRHEAEWIPFWFSLVAPLVLVVGLVLRGRFPAAWRDFGHAVGWCAIAIGFAGVVFHLDSGFFHQRTIKSLVYAAPFAAPLAYTGLGLLLVMNRMVDDTSEEWPRWVILLGLGGVFGNFVFSLTDHAQNGFYHWTEWIPVASSALAVGFLTTIFATPVTRPFVRLCAIVLALQVAVGLLGFYLHNRANWRGPSASAFDNFVFGAPALAPMLFADLSLLCGLGLWSFREHLPAGAAATSWKPDA